MSGTEAGSVEPSQEFVEQLRQLARTLERWTSRESPLATSHVTRALRVVEEPGESIDQQAVRADVSQLVPRLTDAAFAKRLARRAQADREWVVLSADVVCQLARLVLELHRVTARPPYTDVVGHLETGLERSEPEAVFDALEAAVREATRLSRLVCAAEHAVDSLDSGRFPHPRDTPDELRERVAAALEDGALSSLESITQRLHAEWSRADLHRFDGESFECLVAELYEIRGYSTTLTARSNDFGVDVEATKGGTTKFVQCKLFRTTKVSGPEVGEYIAMHLLFDVDAVVIVTSNGFTEQAYLRKALVERPLRYIDGEELCRHLTHSPLVPPVIPALG